MSMREVNFVSSELIEQAARRLGLEDDGLFEPVVRLHLNEILDLIEFDRWLLALTHEKYHQKRHYYLVGVQSRWPEIEEAGIKFPWFKGKS